jgi:hypothetical protein
MQGFPGDGELSIEVCEGARDEVAALAQLSRLDEDPSEWRVAGRVWCRLEVEDEWWICDSTDPGAVEFWELRSRKLYDPQT